MLTNDANVFVSAATPSEVFHADSDRFLTQVRGAGLEIICPALILPETASGIIRPTGSTIAAGLAVTRITTFPNLALIALSQEQAEEAARIAASCRVRGADAVYVAVAQEHGTTLVTWDQELLERGAAAVLTLTPSDWLAANPI